MNAKIEKAKKFKLLNDIAIKGQKVVLGSSYMNNFPFYEIIQRKVTDYVVYNRSIEDLTVKEAIDTCEDCLRNLEPQNIILSFGENEMMNDLFFINYKTLILKIKKLYRNSKIAIVNTIDNEEINSKLIAIANDNKINYINLSNQENLDCTFGKLSSFFRNGQISFFDAINSIS